MRLVSAVAALLRRFRAERGVIALIFIVIALTSFAVSAGPRLYARVADDGLRYEASRGTAIQRNIQFSTIDRIPPGSEDPFDQVAARGEAFRRSLPPVVEALVDDTSYVVETTRFGLADPPRFTTFVTFRQQADVDGLVDLVAGRWPERVLPDPVAPIDAPRVFEIALTEAAAETIGVVPGDRLPANVDATDALLRYEFPRPATAVELVVSGLVTVRDAADPRWFDDRSLLEASIGGTEDAPIAYATALFAPAAYVNVLALDLPTVYRWNLFVDADRLDARGLDALTQELRQLGTRYSTTGSSRPEVVLMRTGLGQSIERYKVQRATTDTALSLAALGPLAVAAGAVGLLGVLVVRRRRRALALARGRGASGGQLLAAQLWEGLLVTVPAALVGLGLAVALVAAPAGDLSSTGAILVAVGATTLLLLATWPVARRARRDLERDDPPVFRLSPRRLVFETLIVGLSLAAVWLLRERGLAAQDASGASPGFDLFLAAAPLLVGLAVGLLVIRLYPIPIRGLGWITARRRDLVPVLGLRSLGRHPTAGYLPLLILTLTVAIGTLSVVVAASLVRGQVAVSWQDVGADFRVEATSGRSLDPRFDPRAIEGVEAAAAGLVINDAGLSTAPGKRTTVVLEALEAGPFEEVVAGSPVALPLSTWFAGRPTGTEAGTVAYPIPAIVSIRLGPTAPVLDPGDRFALAFRGRTMSFQVVERRDTFPGIPLGASFVIAPLGSIVDGWDGSPLRPTTWFVRGPAALAEGLREAVAGSGDTTLVSRNERYAAMRDAPLVAAVVGGFAIAVAVAAAYAALAVVTVVALEAQRRSREAAFLRTLGLTDRQLGLLTALEQGAPLLLALVIGVGVGLGLAWLIAPGIDLGAFSRAGAVSGLDVDWLSIGGVALAVAAVVTVAVAVSSWVARRLDVGSALRIGEE